MRVAAALVLLLWAVAAAASAVDLCSETFCACPDAGKRVECKCDVARKVSGQFDISDLIRWDGRIIGESSPHVKFAMEACFILNLINED